MDINFFFLLILCSCVLFMNEVKILSIMFFVFFVFIMNIIYSKFPKLFYANLLFTLNFLYYTLDKKNRSKFFFKSIFVYILIIILIIKYTKEPFDIDYDGRKSYLIEKLYNTNISYKIDGKFTNMSQDMINILKSDDRYVPYIEFLYELSSYQKRKFPSSRNECHKFINDIFLKTFSIIKLAQEDHFEKLSSPTNDYIIKSKNNFTKLDYELEKSFQDIMKKRICQSDKNYKKQEFNNYLRIIF